LPNGQPTSGLAISDQYWDSHGVKFSSFTAGQTIYMAEVGNDDFYAYECGPCGNVANGVMPEHASMIGKFFLTDDEGYGSGASSLG